MELNYRKDIYKFFIDQDLIGLIEFFDIFNKERKKTDGGGLFSIQTKARAQSRYGFLNLFKKEL